MAVELPDNMDEEFNTWGCECDWYWDNSYGDLLPVGKSSQTVFCNLFSVVISASLL